MILDPIKATIAPYMLLVKLGGLLLVIALLWGHGYSAGRDRWQGKFDTETAAHKATRAAHASVLRDLANKTKAAEAAVKAAGEQAKADRKASDDRFRESQREADRAKRDLAAALRRGSVRLQDHWTCRVPGAAEGGAAGATGRQDADADLRAAGAADLVAAGDAADRWITWLQSELTSTRKACQ